MDDLLQTRPVRADSIFSWEVNRGVTLSTQVFGISHGIPNWAYDWENPKSFEKIARVVSAKYLFVLSPFECNGKVTNSSSGVKKFVREKTTFYCVGRNDGVLFNTDELPRGGVGAVMTSADCLGMTFRTRDGRKVCFVHGARNSIIQFDEDTHGKIYIRRKHNVIASALSALGSRPNDVFVHLSMGIRSHFPHRTDDPVYGAQNALFAKWLANTYPYHCNILRGESLDMYALATAELYRCGVRSDHITVDHIDTGADITPCGKAKFASNANDTGALKGRRNLTLVQLFSLGT